MAHLFHDFLVLQVEEAPDGRKSPRVSWRLPPSSSSRGEVLDVDEIFNFCYPYPELLKKTTARSMEQAEEFVFVVSRAGTGDEGALARTFGFCRRAIGPGPYGRHDLAPRYPECLCLVTSQPLFTLFPAMLKVAHGLRLLVPGALADFVIRARTPTPFPLRGETFRVPLPGGLGGSDLRFEMPAAVDSPVFSDVSVAPLLHALGARRYLLLLTALLSERRVIMMSANLRKLTVCVHAAVAALQPLTWQHIFIPLLPSRLLSYACAPYPFLIGLHASHLDEVLDPEGELALSEVLVVDLDSSALHVAGTTQQGDNVPPLLRDIIGAGLFSPPRSIRRGADTLDGMRVRATRFLASRLEMLTPIDISSTVEKYSEKTADAGHALLEQLHSIVRAHSGKTAAWRLATSDEVKTRNSSVDLEAPVPFSPPGAAALAASGSSSGAPTAASTGSSNAQSAYELGPDDASLSEALLVFFLQLIGDPRPFGLPGPAAADTIDSVRQRYLASRFGAARVMGACDSAPLTGFLEEFVTTQMFQCFSLARDQVGRANAADSYNPFFVCASTIGQLGQPFDRVRCYLKASISVEYFFMLSPSLIPPLQKSARLAVRRLQLDGAGASLRYHPVALRLTSNSPFSGNADTELTALCRAAGRHSGELHRIIRTVEWRLNDCRGSKWKHGLKALQLLRGLLIFGPESAVADGLNLLFTVHALQYFKSGLPPGAGSGSGEHVRNAARVLFPLLCDMRKLQRERVRLQAPPFFVATLERCPVRKVPQPPGDFRSLHAQFSPAGEIPLDPSLHFPPPFTATEPLDLRKPPSALLDFEDFVVKEVTPKASLFDDFDTWAGMATSSNVTVSDFSTPIPHEVTAPTVPPGETSNVLPEIQAPLDPPPAPTTPVAPPLEVNGDGWDSHWFTDSDPFAMPSLEPVPPFDTSTANSAPSMLLPSEASASSVKKPPSELWEMLLQNPLGVPSKPSNIGTRSEIPPQTGPHATTDPFAGLFMGQSGP